MNARWKFGLITAVALLSIFVTLSLGRWQLGRAAQKQALQSSTEAQGQLARLEAPGLLAAPDALRDVHRRVLLRGQWLGQHTVLLDNRQMNGKVGYYVVTPLQLEGEAAVVLVQRGWLARNFLDRNATPQVDTPVGVVTLEGRIAPPPSKLYELGSSGAGLIRQNIDLASFRAETGVPLLNVSVQQTGALSEGLLREWPVLGSGVDKHYGYAFQWFALSGLIAILYVWFQIVRRFIFPRRR